MPSGKKVLYEVPTVQVQNFSKEDMFKKRLLILIPFYVLRYEKDIKNSVKSATVCMRSRMI